MIGAEFAPQIGLVIRTVLLVLARQSMVVRNARLGKFFSSASIGNRLSLYGLPLVRESRKGNVRVNSSCRESPHVVLFQPADV